MKKKQQNSSSTADIVDVDASAPDPEPIQRAVSLLAQGGVLIFPTTGLYGLGADALTAHAIDRVFRIKHRPTEMPLLVMVAEPGDLKALVRRIPEHARRLLALWPGGITFVFEAADGVPQNLTGGTGKIGVRVPAHPVARALVEAFGGPVTATSANLSGRASPARVTDIDPELLGGVDLVLDAGPLAGGSGSTVLDVTCRPIRLVREGAVTWPTIQRMLSRP